MKPDTRCRWCGRRYSEHHDEVTVVTLRVPCLATKQWFLPRREPFDDMDLKERGLPQTIELGED